MLGIVYTLSSCSLEGSRSTKDRWLCCRLGLTSLRRRCRGCPVPIVASAFCGGNAPSFCGLAQLGCLKSGTRWEEMIELLKRVCVCHSQQTSLGTMMFCTVSKCFSLSKPFKNPSPRTVHAGLVLRAPYNRIVSLLHGDRPWPCAVETAST